MIQVTLGLYQPEPGEPSQYKTHDGVAVKDLKLSDHNSETMLFTIYSYYGNLN